MKACQDAKRFLAKKKSNLEVLLIDSFKKFNSIIFNNLAIVPINIENIKSIKRVAKLQTLEKHSKSVEPLVTRVNSHIEIKSGINKTLNIRSVPSFSKDNKDLKKTPTKHIEK